MAVPRLSDFDGLRILQLRHPLPVIRSFTGTRFFSEPARYGGQSAYARAFYAPIGDDVTDAMRWWVFWNDRAAQNADMVVKLEELDQPVLADVLERIGERDSDRRAEAAFELVKPGANSSRSRGGSPDRLALDDLPDGPDLEALHETADRFGYSLNREPPSIT